jgi:hypothetical protein
MQLVRRASIARCQLDQVLLIGGIASVRCGLRQLGCALTIERGSVLRKLGVVRCIFFIEANPLPD